MREVGSESPCPVFEYHIDVTNQNYINAIIKYNLYTNIINIDGDISQLKCSSLPQILKVKTQTGMKKINITCESINSVSTYGIFPIINSLYDDNEEKKEAISKSVNEFIKEQAHFIDKYITTEFNRSALLIGPLKTPQLANMNQEQALLIAHEVNRLCHLSGMIHLPRLQVILFQMMGANDHGKHDVENYVLKYGEFSNIRSMYVFDFDLDEGFKSDSPLSEDQKIIEELQKYFLIWKKNGYQGDIISAKQAALSRIESTDVILNSPDTMPNSPSFFYHPTNKSIKNELEATESMKQCRK